MATVTSSCTLIGHGSRPGGRGLGGGGGPGGEFGRNIETRPVSAAHELGRPAPAVIVALGPDLDALSDQDAPDAHSCAVAQNAEIIQAGAVAVALGQLLGRDRDRDRRPWIPFNHLPVPAASPPCQYYAGMGSGGWLICATIRPDSILNNRDRSRTRPAKPD